MVVDVLGEGSCATARSPCTFEDDWLASELPFAAAAGLSMAVDSDADM
jgi:hypothetical protein